MTFGTAARCLGKKSCRGVKLRTRHEETTATHSRQWEKSSNTLLILEFYILSQECEQLKVGSAVMKVKKSA